MSILTKKKNGINHKAKNISIPRNKKNKNKTNTRKNVGKSRKNIGVKTMKGGLFKSLFKMKSKGSNVAGAPKKGAFVLPPVSGVSQVNKKTTRNARFMTEFTNSNTSKPLYTNENGRQKVIRSEALKMVKKQIPWYSRFLNKTAARKKSDILKFFENELAKKYPKVGEQMFIPSELSKQYENAMKTNKNKHELLNTEYIENVTGVNQKQKLLTLFPNMEKPPESSSNTNKRQYLTMNNKTPQNIINNARGIAERQAKKFLNIEKKTNISDEQQKMIDEKASKLLPNILTQIKKSRIPGLIELQEDRKKNLEQLTTPNLNVVKQEYLKKEINKLDNEISELINPKTNFSVNFNSTDSSTDSTRQKNLPKNNIYEEIPSTINSMITQKQKIQNEMNNILSKNKNIKDITEELKDIELNPQKYKRYINLNTHIKRLSNAKIKYENTLAKIKYENTLAKLSELSKTLDLKMFKKIQKSPEFRNNIVQQRKIQKIFTNSNILELINTLNLPTVVKLPISSESSTDSTNVNPHKPSVAISKESAYAELGKVAPVNKETKIQMLEEQIQKMKNIKSNVYSKFSNNRARARAIEKLESQIALLKTTNERGYLRMDNRSEDIYANPPSANTKLGVNIPKNEQRQDIVNSIEALTQTLTTSGLSNADKIKYENALSKYKNKLKGFSNNLYTSTVKSPTAKPSNKNHPKTFATHAEMEKYKLAHPKYNANDSDPNYH